MNTLIVYPTKNQIKNDAKGAFIPSAMQFRDLRADCGDSITEIGFDPKTFDAKMLPGFFEQIRAGAFGCVALFTHGIASGLPQLHIRRGNCPEFARALTDSVEFVTIGLYACLTALPLSANLNFAETLAAELHRIGKPFRLLTHRTAGHTTRNPNVTIFSGADRLVYPTQLGSSDMIRAYKEQMKTTDLPYRILFENF